MTLTTQVIGQTEKALNAILDRLLAGTDITEPQWVTLTLTVVSGGLPADALTARVSGALKADSAIARERLAELTSAGLVRQNPEGVVEATERGKAQWEAVRAQVTEITQRLWGDLPEEDLAVAGRVLSTVLTRANAALATV
ncbi:MAG: winged helix DNA-binding protein [Hamadaea sp.]|nr:winged helix DNA-binding protein [Hamadaea sp.]